MRVYSCYNPKVIVNQYTGQKVCVPCGKCPSCLDARAALWVQRLDIEQYFTKHTWFVTLQYDDKNVNQMIRLRSEDTPAGDLCYIDSETGSIISYYDDSVSPRSKKDLQFCFDTKVLNVVSVRDIQLLIKNLRQNAKRKYNTNLRYFVTLEYGPTTFRCHAHCLFFIQSSLFSQDFEKLLRYYWQYGNVYDPHIVHGSASSYVASYVNCFTSLPSIFRHKEIRPRSLFSKCPPIGSNIFDAETFRKIFFEGLSEIRIFSPIKSQFVSVPLYRFVEDRLFPRVPRFGLLVASQRVALYRLVVEARYYIIRDGQDFTVSNVAKYLMYRYIFYCPLNLCWIRDYFSFILFEDTQVTLSTLDYKKTSLFFGYWYKVSKTYDDVVKTFNYDSLLRFVRVLMRAYRNSLDFNIDLTHCVDLISSYYAKKSLSQLGKWLDFQNDYFEEHSVTEYLCFDCNFIKLVDGKRLCDIPSWCLYYLHEYNYPLSDDGRYHLTLKYVFDYNDLRSTHDKIYWQNTKTKVQNDYLLKHSNKFQNVINYYEQK